MVGTSLIVPRGCYEALRVRSALLWKMLDRDMSIYQVTRIGKNGEPYSYWQESRRVNGKVKTFYRGPVVPKRPGIRIGDIFRALTELGGRAAFGKLGPPGGRTNRDPKPYTDLDTRVGKMKQNQIAEVDRIYGVDRSSREGFSDTRAKMSPEVFQEYSRALDNIERNASDTGNKEANQFGPAWHAAMASRDPVAASDKAMQDFMAWSAENQDLAFSFTGEDPSEAPE